MAETHDALNAEIALLEARLAAKKQEALNSSTEAIEPELFKKVIREHTSVSQPVSSPVSTSQSVSTPQSRTTTPQDQKKINDLIALSFVKGIAHAVAEAKKFNDPFLIDQLHDQLADEYYQKLLASRQIKPL